MTATVPGAYIATNSFAGTFGVTSVGYMQGMLIEDPVARYFVMGGVLASTETLPMWGGVGVNMTTTPNTGTNPPDSTLGGLISRATTLTAGAGSLSGFSVFNQAYGMVITPASSVPLAASYQSVNWVPLGSNARIVVGVSANFSTWEANSINQLVSWDFVNQVLTTYVPAYATQTATSATYTSSTGIIAITFGTAPFGAGIGAGADGTVVTVTGLAGTGVAPLNGSWAVTGTATSGTVVSLQGPVGLGVLTITGSTGTLTAGGGALPVKVLEIVTSNCLTVTYNSTTGDATWNYNGAVAVIMI